MSHVTSQVSRVTCHVSGDMCQVSHVKCQVYFFIFFSSFRESGGVSWWRICYQQSRPRLVCIYICYNFFANYCSLLWILAIHTWYIYLLYILVYVVCIYTYHVYLVNIYKFTYIFIFVLHIIDNYDCNISLVYIGQLVFEGHLRGPLYAVLVALVFWSLLFSVLLVSGPVALAM